MATIAMFVLVLGCILGWVQSKSSTASWEINWGWAALLLIIALGFITWWVADALDYWLLPWTVLLLGMARVKLIPERPVNAFLIILILLFASYNYIRIILPYPNDLSNPLL